MDFPNPHFEITLVLIPCLSYFSRHQLTEMASPQDRGYVLQVLPALLPVLPQLEGNRSSLRTLKVGHHNKGTTKLFQIGPPDVARTLSPLPPVTNQLCGNAQAPPFELRIVFVQHVPHVV
jgi:hypothetical protein